MKVPSPTRFGLLRTTIFPVILSIAAAAILPNPALAQADLETPEGLIERIYRLVTFPAGTTPDSDIPGDGREPRAGVDSFQLIKRDGRWWIASITNERPSADRPLPEVFEP